MLTTVLLLQNSYHGTVVVVFNTIVLLLYSCLDSYVTIVMLTHYTMVLSVCHVEVSNRKAIQLMTSYIAPWQLLPFQHDMLEQKSDLQPADHNRVVVSPCHLQHLLHGLPVTGGHSCSRFIVQSQPLQGPGRVVKGRAGPNSPWHDAMAVVDVIQGHQGGPHVMELPEQKMTNELTCLCDHVCMHCLC